MQQPVLWFGKHKGKPLSTIPTGYLLWALGNCRLSYGVRAAIYRERVAVEASVMAQGVFAWAASESERHIEAAQGRFPAPGDG